MKKVIVVFFIITLCGVSSCKVSETISSSLSESQNNCLKYNQTVLSNIFKAYQVARLDNNVIQTMDSIMTSISSGKERDTIFIIESCNPPLFSYHAIIWNKDNVFTLSGSGFFVKEVRNKDSLSVMRIIEKWDKSEIISKSHEKPLIYYGDWIESCIASRIVMRQAKCEAVESVFFSEIDINVNVIPYLIE